MDKNTAQLEKKKKNLILSISKDPIIPTAQYI